MRDDLNRNHEDDMKITLNIETNDPADLERIAAALAGKEVAVTTGKPAAAAKKDTAAASTASNAQSAAATQAGTSATTSPDATPPSEGAVPSDQELVAAANVAAGKLGVGGPDKLKNYIAANFKKADGSPGTLKMTAEGDRARLLDTLGKIGRGEITL